MEVAVTSTCLAGVVGLFAVFLAIRWPSLGADRTRQSPSRRCGESPSILVGFGYWILGAVLPLVRYLRITPTFLSLLSLPASVGAAAAVGTGHFASGGPLVLFAFSLDALDGLLARELGIDSNAGEVIDATIDRYNDVLIMLGFLYYYRADLVPWLLASAALIGTVVVSYTRAKGESFGVRTDVGIMQRQERALWLGLGASIAPAVASVTEVPSSHPYHYPVVAALGAVALGTNVTAVYRARLVVRTLLDRARSESAKDRA